jgi:hypothetical protein
MASQKHRNALLGALAEKEIPMSTSLEEVLSIMGVDSVGATITFKTATILGKHSGRIHCQPVLGEPWILGTQR